MSHFLLPRAWTGKIISLACFAQLTRPRGVKTSVSISKSRLKSDCGFLTNRGFHWQAPPPQPPGMKVPCGSVKGRGRGLGAEGGGRGLVGGGVWRGEGAVGMGVARGAGRARQGPGMEQGAVCNALDVLTQTPNSGLRHRRQVPESGVRSAVLTLQ